MPHVTTILGNEVGIQYQGTRDASSLTGAAQVSGLIVGQFKRGRLDQPMTITLENVKGTLGEDLDNPDYLAVLDALAGGVPSVQVMRVSNALPLVCTEIGYYHGGWEIYPQSNIEMTPNEHNSLLSDIYDSIKVYADGVELPLIKSLAGDQLVFPKEGEANVKLGKEGQWWKLSLGVNGGMYNPIYNTIRVCAVHPVELQPIAL